MKEKNILEENSRKIFNLKLALNQKEYRTVIKQSTDLFEEIQKIQDKSKVLDIQKFTVLRIRLQACFNACQDAQNEKAMQPENKSLQTGRTNSDAKLISDYKKYSTPFYKYFDDFINRYQKFRKPVKFDGKYKANLTPEDVFVRQIELLLLDKLFKDMGRNIEPHLLSFKASIEQGLIYILDHVESITAQYKVDELSLMIQQYVVAFSDEFIVDEIKKRLIFLGEIELESSKINSALIQYERLFQALEACLELRESNCEKEKELISLCQLAAKNRNKKTLPLILIRIDKVQKELNQTGNSNLIQLTNAFYVKCYRHIKPGIRKKKLESPDLMLNDLNNKLLTALYGKSKGNYNGNKIVDYHGLVELVYYRLNKIGSCDTDILKLANRLYGIEMDNPIQSISDSQYNKLIRCIEKVEAKSDVFSQTLVDLAVGYLKYETPTIQTINVSSMGIFSESASILDKEPLQNESNLNAGI